MTVEREIRDAAHTLRTGPVDLDRIREPLADLLDRIADISRGLRGPVYEGLWQGRALAIARTINEGTHQ
ncbi:MAG TPA: hypothetical protein VF202_10795 [Trueperaceae bacterium]